VRTNGYGCVVEIVLAWKMHGSSTLSACAIGGYGSRWMEQGLDDTRDRVFLYTSELFGFFSQLDTEHCGGWWTFNVVTHEL